MNTKTICTAIAEAKRFLSRAKAALENYEGSEYHESKVNGAVKRASMDLTRALADLRRPG